MSVPARVDVSDACWIRQVRGDLRARSGPLSMRNEPPKAATGSRIRRSGVSCAASDSSAAAVREFSDEPVSDEVVYAILDTARFSPSGGNRQGWRVVLIRDCQLRRALRDLYRPAWREYLAQAKAGLVAWAPITDRERERQAIAEAAAGPALTEAERAGFVENLDRSEEHTSE